jgi:hypothetical protein
MRYSALCCTVLLACGGSRSAVDAVPASTSHTVRVGVPGGTLTLPLAEESTLGTISVGVPLQRAWEVLPAVYSKLGIPPANILASEHMVANPEARVRRTIGGRRASLFLDCGSQLGERNADTYTIDLVVQTRLKAADAEHTAVSTQIDATARSASFAGNAVRCTSTGKLEEWIAEETEAQARR